jgi:hypothetical protein
MLINESRFTPLTYEIKRQIKSLIGNFLRTNIERKGKASNLTLDQAKQNVKKLIHNAPDNRYFIGYIHLKTPEVRSIPIYIFESGAGAAYYEDSDEYIEHISISFETLFHNIEVILAKLAHEIIHAIQINKKHSGSYEDVVNKIINGEELSKYERFIYYTEPSEFEANASELSYIITRFFERRDVNKEKIIYILESVLKFPKSKMFKFFDSFYIRYLVNLPEEEHDIYLSYTKSMFADKLNFLKTVALSPDNTNKNIKISERYWRQFKQKLFNLTQYLKKRYLKNTKIDK